MRLLLFPLALSLAACSKPTEPPAAPTPAAAEPKAAEPKAAEPKPSEFANRKPFKLTVQTGSCHVQHQKLKGGDEKENKENALEDVTEIVVQLAVGDPPARVELNDKDRKELKELTEIVDGALKQMGDPPVRFDPDDKELKALKDDPPVRFDLDCEGDGEYEYQGVTEMQKCVYPCATGATEHHIWLRGEIPSIVLCDPEEKGELKPDHSGQVILSVDDWGDIEWKSMSHFASRCVALNALPADPPNLSHVTDMSYMFQGSRINVPLEKWDVSHVTDMSGLFKDNKSFNQPLESWDVSHVEKMSYMFNGTEAFNQPLNQWKTSGVKEMGGMFAESHAFNQPLDKWNTSQVESMDGMFSGAKAFNQPLDAWDISKVCYIEGMFENASAFNHYPSKWILPHSGWRPVKGDPLQGNEPMFKGTKLEKMELKKPLKRESRSHCRYY